MVLIMQHKNILKLSDMIKQEIYDSNGNPYKSLTTLGLEWKDIFEETPVFFEEIPLLLKIRKSHSLKLSSIVESELRKPYLALRESIEYFDNRILKENNLRLISSLDLNIESIGVEKSQSCITNSTEELTKRLDLREGIQVQSNFSTPYHFVLADLASNKGQFYGLITRINPNIPRDFKLNQMGLHKYPCKGNFVIAPNQDSHAFKLFH